MTQVFNFDKIERVDIQKGRWVRLKSGIYQGDLAQVVAIEDPISRIFVKIIPRLNEFNNYEYEKITKKNQGQNQNQGNNNNTISINSFMQKKTTQNNPNPSSPSPRPKQRLFNPANFNYSDLKKITHPILRDQVTIWNKMNFLDGFLIKSVRIKSLILEDIDPKLEELRIFNYNKYRKGNENDDNNDNDIGMNDLLNTIQESELTKKRFFKQGDKVRIIVGSLNGITGKVITHTQKLVSIIPDIEDYDEIIELPEDYVVKLFLPGDLVKVYKGPNTGKYGLVTKSEDELCYVYSDSLNVEFKVSCRDLILSSQHFDESVTNSYFQIGDLVKINGNNMVCYILSVHLHHLKVIDTRNEIKNVNMKDITKITQKYNFFIYFQLKLFLYIIYIFYFLRI
jgi:transcription elongation factor SPT5